MASKSTKVRSNYPALIRLFSLLIILPLFFYLARWVLSSEAIAFGLTGLLGIITITTTIVGIIPMHVSENIIRHMNTRWRPHNVKSVSSKTVQGKFLHGVASTTITLTFDNTEHKLVLTDTRYPMLPTVSGYRNEEADALISWLSNVPSNVEGFESVTHLIEMLKIKKTLQKENGNSKSPDTIQDHE